MNKKPKFVITNTATMKKYRKLILILGCLLIIMCLPTILHAQVTNPLDDPDAPFDGGLGILIAAGVGYGLKKRRENKKKKEDVVI